MIHIRGFLGNSASRKVVVGFADASLLHSLSFADVLDEDSGTGYQRRFNRKHSLDFRRYLQETNSTTIPLTFNLRPSSENTWGLTKGEGGHCIIRIDPVKPKVLSQVDCQHRLGFLSDSDVSLPFMMFLGLTLREEMAVFNVINGKAKGLSASLLDFHDAELIQDVARERPELFIALQLHEDSESPWHGQLDLGGNRTSGMKRRASLRTMQKAIKRFLNQTKAIESVSPQQVADVVAAFWRAITIVLEEEWRDSRRHMITKGIGVYALMGIAGDLFIEARLDYERCDENYFCEKLFDFITNVDWTNHGTFKALGGESGANEALTILRSKRPQNILKVV